MSTVGLRIKNARTAQRISIAELAKKTGISKGTLSMTERDVTVLGADNLLKICRVLGLSADFVLTGKMTAVSESLADSIAVRHLLLEIYASGELATVFAAIQGLKTDQIEVIVRLAKTMAEENKKRKK